jgi:hypothetical protein
MKYRQLIKKLTSITVSLLENVILVRDKVLNKVNKYFALVLDNVVQGIRIANLNIISITYLLFIILGVITSCYVNNIFTYEIICYIPYNIDIPTLHNIKPLYSLGEYSTSKILKIPAITTVFQFHYADFTIMQPYWDINLNNRELMSWIQKVYFVVNGKCIFLTDIHSLKIYYALSTREQLAYFQTWCNVYVVYTEYELIHTPNS